MGFEMPHTIYIAGQTTSLLQWAVGYEFEGKFFFSISEYAYVVSLGIKLTGFQGFFFWITFWVGQVQKTKISLIFNRGPRGGPKIFFWSPMVLW